MVFAPPGLAAIAISQEQYFPLFPLEGIENVRSAIVVREDSSIKTLAELQDKAIAFGQPGSATGYYLPIYNL
jgi:phosphonate transport system substrate-binding protein